MNYISIFEKKDLLTDGRSNTKTAKNDMKTYYLSLQPTDLNSKKLNLCRFATKECRRSCLQFAGRQGMSIAVQARQRKTEFLVNHPKEFMEKLWMELTKIDSKGTKSAIRLNLLSDVNWEKQIKEFLGPDVSLADFKNIQFYDYTKDPIKVKENNLSNYNLTFSFSGGNWQWCEKFLKEKLANVAVVFKKELPLEYKSFPVLNGDESDERFLEEKGVIVGLKYKIPRGVKYEPNKFVIEN